MVLHGGQLAFPLGLLCLPLRANANWSVPFHRFHPHLDQLIRTQILNCIGLLLRCCRASQLRIEIQTCSERCSSAQKDVPTRDLPRLRRTHCRITFMPFNFRRWPPFCRMGKSCLARPQGWPKEPSTRRLAKRIKNLLSQKTGGSFWMV